MTRERAQEMSAAELERWLDARGVYRTAAAGGTGVWQVLFVRRDKGPITGASRVDMLGAVVDAMSQLESGS